MYSITSRNSFDMIQIVYDKIVDFCGVSDVPCVVVGSKSDLQHRYATYCIPVNPLLRVPFPFLAGR